MKHAFQGSSHARVNNRAIMTMDRTARGVPEVVVRVTGRQHGGGHVLANFAYISRLGHGADEELALHTSDGEVLRDGRDMQILAQDWHEWEMGGGARRQGATSISMILSMPTGTDPERLQEAALDFARTEFANRSWVASLHVDRDHPHVHLTFARRDHDGRRFHPDRDDLFRYRQCFAEKLRDRGIEANATPARARGIDPVHEPIAARKVRAKGEVPRIDKSRADRAERLRQQGIPDPVEAVLASRQAKVRSAHIRSFVELSRSASAVDKFVARSLERLIATKPAPEPNSVRAIRKAREVRVERGVETAPGTPIDREVSSTPDAPKPMSTAERMWALHEELIARRERTRSPALPAADREKRPLSAVAVRVQAILKDADIRKDEVKEAEQARMLSLRVRAMREERIAPPKSPDLAEAKETSRLDHLPGSTKRFDLPGAIQRYARAAVDIAGMEEKGLPVLPHQRTALNQAGEMLDKVKYHGTDDLAAAIARNPLLARDAAAGDLGGTLTAMAVEAEVRMDPRLRAERFMERWWTVENERRLGDPMVVFIRKEMIDGLDQDPDLRAELERCAPELGLKPSRQQQTPEQLLQQWQIEMDRERDRQQDRGFDR